MYIGQRTYIIHYILLAIDTCVFYLKIFVSEKFLLNSSAALSIYRMMPGKLAYIFVIMHFGVSNQLPSAGQQ